MTDTDREFVLQAISRYDEHVQQHKGFREQSIALMVTLDGLGLTVLLTIDDHVLRITGCGFVLALTWLLWFLGEKNLAMVINYQHLSSKAGEQLWPDAQAELFVRERHVWNAMAGAADVQGIEPLRGMLGVAHRTPFRSIWRLFALLVLILAVFIAVVPLL